jgi:hypothetical protein
VTAPVVTGQSEAIEAAMLVRGHEQGAADPRAGGDVVQRLVLGCPSEPQRHLR